MLRVNRQAGCHGVTAKRPQQIGLSGNGSVDVHPFHRAGRAAPQLTRRGCNQDHRAAVTLRQLRGDDADHPSRPSRMRQHQDRGFQ
jgi:hypothetical protein